MGWFMTKESEKTKRVDNHTKLVSRTLPVTTKEEGEKMIISSWESISRNRED